MSVHTKMSFLNDQYLSVFPNFSFFYHCRYGRCPSMTFSSKYRGQITTGKCNMKTQSHKSAEESGKLCG